MEDNTTTEAAEPRVSIDELVRPKEGRVFGGVAQGLSDRTGDGTLAGPGRVHPARLRRRSGTRSLRRRMVPDPLRGPGPVGRTEGVRRATGTRSWVGIGLVFLAALILLDNFTFLDGGVVWAVGLLIVGLLLYTGDLPRLFNGGGNARHR